MAAQKPSPHRFIAQPKSKSSLRHAIAAHTPKASALEFKKITPAKRFVVAPAQRALPSDVTSRAPGRVDRVEEPNSSASTDCTPRPKPQRKLGRVESIEEASQSSPSRPPEDDAFEVLQTVERDHLPAGEEYDHADDEMLFESAPHSKRRRTSPPSPSLHHPPPETPLPSAASHRFRFPPQTPAALDGLAAPASHTTSITSSTTPRPHFILPPQPTSPQKPSRPLPELFSPSRKTQKYVPNGLASTVQSWLIDAAQTGLAVPDRSTGALWNRDRDDGVRLKVRLSTIGAEDGEDVECFPGSMVFACGETEPGLYNASRALDLCSEDERIRLLLAGQGAARGSMRVKLRAGTVVGIRAPTWDIHVGGHAWVVGVDWVVL